VQVWHFPGQKLRLGGDALGADPTYLLYLAYRSRGELRRIDFEPDCAGATLSDFAASESTRKPPPHTRGISRARSFDLEVTPWAPTRLTSCISHPGLAEAYERLRSTLCPARAPFHHLAAPESTRKPPVCRSGISRARSFDLEVTPWAPTRLTSCIFHSGHTEAYEPLRSTRSSARAPFRDLAAPQSTRKPPVCRSGISRARSFDLEVTRWAPTRLTSCIFHPGPAEYSGASAKSFP